MTAARGVALLALVAVIAVVALVLLRDGDTTTYRLRFQDAGQLVKDDDVRSAGAASGRSAPSS
jgi:phospholipid/cholesterol/gamma-HCH transport system substrate-binding protein